MRRSLATVLAVALLCPHHSARAADGAWTTTTNVGIDDALAGHFTTRIQERASLSLRTLQGNSAPPTHGLRLAVRIELVDAEAEDYQVQATATWLGGEHSTAAKRCDGCVEQEVEDAAAVLISEALGAYRESITAEPEPAATSSEAPEESTEPRPADIIDPLPTDAPARSLSALGWTGVALSAVGVAGVATGLVLALRADTVDASTGVPEVRSTKTPGWVTVGISAPTLVVGAVLWAVDAKRQSSVTVAPLWTPRMAGASLTGQF